jgi:hypothetical protein
MLFDTVEAHCPDLHMKLTQAQYDEIINEVLGCLSMESEPLLEIVKALFGETIFDGSTIGLQYNSCPPDRDGYMGVPISMGLIYIRPNKNNILLSLNIEVFRGFTHESQTHLTAVNMALEIDNSEAKKAFESLYKNYRAQIIRLLEYGQITFLTDYYSEIVGKSKSKKSSVKLDEYFSDPEIDNCFSLRIFCHRKVGYSSIVRAFLSLAIIYIACKSISTSGKNWQFIFEKNTRKLLD